jgi:hypothetical protein
MPCLSPPLNCRSEVQAETTEKEGMALLTRILQESTIVESTSPKSPRKAKMKAETKITKVEEQRSTVSQDHSLQPTNSQELKPPKARSKASSIPPLVMKGTSSAVDTPEKPKAKTPRAAQRGDSMLSPRKDSRDSRDSRDSKDPTPTVGQNAEKILLSGDYLGPETPTKSVKSEVSTPKTKTTAAKNENMDADYSPLSHFPDQLKGTPPSEPSATHTALSVPVPVRRPYNRTETSKKLIVPARRKDNPEINKYTVGGKPKNDYRLTWNGRVYVIFWLNPLPPSFLFLFSLPSPSLPPPFSSLLTQ